MLGKLLKYDLKWIYKVVGVFYILAFIFSLMARLFGLVDNSLLFDFLAGILSGASIAMIVSCLINTFMRSWVRFVNNIYKDESYLTHTLPVEKKTIYLAKVLSAIICSFTTVLAIILCLFICYYSKENMARLKEMLELTANTYDTTVLNLLLVIAVVIFLEIVYILLIGYVGIIIGHKANANKMVRSIVYSFILYSLTQGAMLLIIFIIGLFNKDIMNIMNTTDMVNINSIKTFMLLGIGIYIIINVFYYFVGKKLLEKGVNIA